MYKKSVKYIYLLRTFDSDNTACFKIGYTKNDPKLRIKQLQTGNKEEIELICSFKSEFGTRLEANLKRMYKQYNAKGEWFYLPEDIVKDFLSICEKHEHNLNMLYNSNSYIQDLNHRLES